MEPHHGRGRRFEFDRPIYTPSLILTLQAGVFTIFAVHVILVMRLYGLYGSKRVMYGLCSLLCSTTAVEIYVVSRLVPNLYAVTSVPSVGAICVSTVGSKFALIWYARLELELMDILISIPSLGYRF